jgi:diphthamide synthase subunit DPH2
MDMLEDLKFLDKILVAQRYQHIEKILKDKQINFIINIKEKENLLSFRDNLFQVCLAIQGLFIINRKT